MFLSMVHTKASVSQPMGHLPEGGTGEEITNLGSQS